MLSVSFDCASFFITPLVFLTFILARTKTNHNWYFYQFLFSQVYIWTTLYISALLIKTQLRSIHQNKSNNLVDDLSWKMQLSLFAIVIMFCSNNIAIDSWENGWRTSELVLCFLFCKKYKKVRVMLFIKQYKYSISNKSKSWFVYITWIEYILQVSSKDEVVYGGQAFAV
jgi:DMSO reductase anchor subunit